MVKFKFYGIAIICVFALYFAGIFTGYQMGVNKGKIEALEALAATIQVREEIDNETANLDTVNLCISLGGMPDNCATILRGLEKTTQSK